MSDIPGSPPKMVKSHSQPTFTNHEKQSHEEIPSKFEEWVDMFVTLPPNLKHPTPYQSYSPEIRPIINSNNSNNNEMPLMVNDNSNANNNNITNDNNLLQNPTHLLTKENRMSLSMRVNTSNSSDSDISYPNSNSQKNDNNSEIMSKHHSNSTQTRHKNNKNVYYSYKHPNHKATLLCKHRHSCIENIVFRGFFRTFAGAYMARTSWNLLTSIISGAHRKQGAQKTHTHTQIQRKINKKNQ